MASYRDGFQVQAIVDQYHDVKTATKVRFQEPGTEDDVKEEKDTDTGVEEKTVAVEEKSPLSDEKPEVDVNSSGDNNKITENSFK